MSEKVGASTSRNPKGLHGLYRDNFTLLFAFLDAYATTSSTFTKFGTKAVE
jgi:hypothetical protein